MNNSTTSVPRASQPPRDWRRGFWSLIVTQFQTGFNDNGLKYLVIYLIIGMNLPQARRDSLVPIVGALFAIPFILFSMTGGYFADRYSKRSVTIGTKFLEIGVMAFFILGLAMRSLPMECAGVFLISTEGALFGPSKYGLLPELLPEKRLSWGNGIMEFGTFLAGIGGTVAAGELAERYSGREIVAGFLLLACSLIGLVTSLGISRIPAADPTKKFRWNPLGDFLTQMKTILADRVLAWAVLGNTYLFFLAALLQLAIVIYGHDVLRIDETHITYLQASVAIGIGLGSVAAGYLSGGKIEYGLIPLGAVGMTVFGALLYNPGHTLVTAGIHLAFLGISGGLFAVPLNALIQHRPKPEQKGGVIAAANLVSFIGIALASGVYPIITNVFHQTAAGIFLDGAILTLVTTAYSIYLLPDSLVRFVLWAATHSIYRIRVEGRDNIPESGGALFVSNHMSFVDALLVDRFDRSLHSLPDVQGHLRSSLRETVRENDSRDSDFLRAAAARNASLPARSHQRDQERRSRLHLRRRADHAHRTVASVPPRHGTHHERRRRSDHSGKSRRRVGQHFQLRARTLHLEAAALDSLSRHGKLWQADAVRDAALRRAPRGPGFADRCLPSPSRRA